MLTTQAQRDALRAKGWRLDDEALGEYESWKNDGNGFRWRGSFEIDSALDGPIVQVRGELGKILEAAAILAPQGGYQ